MASTTARVEHCVDLSTELLWVADTTHLVRVNPAFERALGYAKHELLSRPWLDFVHPADRNGVRAMVDGLAASKGPGRCETRFAASHGRYRRVDWTAVARNGLVYAAGRDVGQREQEPDWSSEAQCLVRDSQVRLRALAEQQEALRRVATLVAHGVSPDAVFSAVAGEVAHSLKVCRVVVLRHEPDNTAVLVAAYNTYTEFGNPPAHDARFILDGDNTVTRVLGTGRRARMASDAATGTAAARMRELGIRATVGIPIVVGGRVWGMIIVGSPLPQALPPDTEARVGDFADLVAISIANAAARAEVIASRARIVATADDARRRFERDLHDGAQQRLISLALQLSAAKDAVPPELAELKSQLSQAVSHVNDISTEIREISHGLHPAILSTGGLGPALKMLARRSPVPVVLELAVDHRLPDAAEVATYYIAAEALTNAAKHAHASEVMVCASAEDDHLCLTICDDGVGGADSGKGSGLVGLIDRVEALGGRMHVHSPPGGGTSLNIAIPLAQGSGRCQ
jgi:PAS domain S-box-containing protein